MSRRRNLTIISAIAIAALATLVLLKAAGSKKQAVAAQVPLAKVYVVTQPIKAGTKGEDIGKYAQVKQVRDEDRAPNAINQIEQLQGLVATVDLVVGEQVLQSRFGTTATKSGVTIPPDLISISLLLSADRVVGGRVEAGKDQVAVVATMGALMDGNSNVLASDETHIMLHKVPVVNVQLPASQGQTAGSSAPEAQDTIPSGSLIVTLAVTAPNAERLVFASERGSLWLAKEPNDASEGGSKLVDRLNIWDEVASAPGIGSIPTDLPPDPNAPTTTTPGGGGVVTPRSATTTTTVPRPTTLPKAATGASPSTTTTTIKRPAGVFSDPNAASSRNGKAADTTVVRLGH